MRSDKGVGMANDQDVMKELNNLLGLLEETLETVEVVSDEVESRKLNVEALTEEIDELNDQLEEVVFRKDYEG